MKNKLFWVLILLAQTFYAQEITGSWQGELDFNGMKLPLVLNIKKVKDQYISTAKSPKQSDEDILVDKTEFVNNQLTFEIAMLNASYKGEFKTDHFEGNFVQKSFSVPLHLYKSTGEKTEKVSDLKLKDIASKNTKHET